MLDRQVCDLWAKRIQERCVWHNYGIYTTFRQLLKSLWQIVSAVNHYTSHLQPETARSSVLLPLPCTGNFRLLDTRYIKPAQKLRSW